MTEPLKPAAIEPISFAAFTLAHELCLALLKTGVLSREDVDAIFSRSINGNVKIGSQTNLAAAEVLTEIRNSIDTEWSGHQAGAPPRQPR